MSNRPTSTATCAPSSRSRSTHDELVVTAESVVDTRVPVLSPAIDRLLPWEEVRERFRYVKDASYDPASDFVFPSRYVPRHDDFAAYARPSFVPGRPTFDVAMDLTLRMYRRLRLRRREHRDQHAGGSRRSAAARRLPGLRPLMIACLRTMGLPARYVSGYMLTQPPPGKPRLIGADASHAWVSVYCRAARRGWIDFDPTNGAGAATTTSPWPSAATIPTSRPMRGVLHGGARHTLARQRDGAAAGGTARGGRAARCWRRRRSRSRSRSRRLHCNPRCRPRPSR